MDGAAGGTTGATRCPSQGLDLQSSRLARGRSAVENAVGRAAAGLAVGHADGRPRSTPGSTSRPTTAAASPGPLALAALERHRFRPAASGPWPPSHGGRTVCPRKAGAPVPAVPDRWRLPIPARGRDRLREIGRNG